MDADTVLIVTNRPAIANSWYSDYEKFLGPDSGYLFVSDTSSLQGKPFVVSRNQYLDMLNNGDYKCIEFVSLQDLKGSIYFGGEFEKLKEVNDIHWDVLIIDEAHEGVDTYKTDVAFDHIDRNFTLHLSGTPFKAIASEKFKEDAIYNWTYADEQKKKRDWQGDQSEQNPYANLPQLNMFTYQMSEVVRDELKQGIEINGETEEWAFDLNEFFAVNQAGNFVHDSAVDKFLDALTTQTKFPFSTPELRDELKHTLWLLNRVDSAKALARKLNNHPVFKDYKVVAAVGDGRLNDDDSAKKAFDSVTEAIAQNDKTITLSVGQLTTGVTIPEWTAVLMLSSIKSASLYMQAAFRAQNPCLFRDKGKFYRKENAYIFDFDPARTLMIFEEFANDLYASTSDGRGDTETRKKHIKELLNFFPVIGEDEDGEMVELDAEKVLSIPRKIRSTEVVNRGFMSNYLFQNISNIFGAPQAVVDIITKFTPVDEPKKQEVKKEDLDRVHVDENGDVKVDEGYVIGLADDIFGDKIYDTVGEQVTQAIDKVAVDNQPKDKALEALQEAFKAQAVKPIVAAATSNYGTEIKASDAKRVEKKLGEDADRLVARTYGDYRIETNQIEKERHEQLAAAAPHEQEKINQEFDQKKAEATEKLKAALNDTVSSFVEDAAKETVRSYETQIEERKKNDVEDTIRDHLRGFARTIPSFLMVGQLRSLRLPLPFHKELEQSFRLALEESYRNRYTIADEQAKLEVTVADVKQGQHNKLVGDNFSSANAGFSLLGCSGCGKSSSLKILLSQYPQVIMHHDDKYGRYPQIVYLVVNCVANSNFSALYASIGNAIDADYINKVAKRHYRGIQKLMDELDDPLNEKKRQKIIEEADRKLDNLLQEHKQTAFAEKIMESAEADEKKIPLKKNIIHNIEMVVADYTSDRIAAAVDRVLISTDETDEKVLTRVVMKLLTDSEKETPTKKQKSKKKPLQTSDMVKFIIE